MSGSNSSAPADRAIAEPLALAVHSLPVAEPARTRSGRLKMLLVLLVCAAPVVASYLTFYVIRPEGRSHHGELVDPPRPMPGTLALAGLDGSAVAPAALRGQWLLIAVAPAACDAACEKRLYAQRQLREMLGRERDRLDKVWLIAGEGTPAPELRAALEATPAMWLLRSDPAAIAGWLAPAPTQALEDHLYLVDPRGQWMLRFPADFEPSRAKRDLDRLLRASASWDRAGR